MYLLVVLYCCEARSRIFTEEHKLEKFESEVVKKIFGSEADGESD
jgi:hypothetical protein